MIRRIIEIIFGVALAFCLFVRYGDHFTKRDLVIWQLLSPQTLQLIVWIALFFLAPRLVFGKYQDHSKYFYNLFVKLFGNPKKETNAK